MDLVAESGRAGRRKVEQEWEKLWARWDEIVTASGLSPKAFLDAWLEVEGHIAQVRLDATSVEGFRPARRSSRRPRA